MNDLLRMNLSAQATDAPRSWSNLQDAIFAATRETNQNLLIQAVAGSGKTTTIIEATRFAASPAIFLAFNKDIATDISAKLPSGEARTLNSLGHRLWMRNASYAKFDISKDEKIISRQLDETNRRKFGYIIGRLISSAKNAGVGLTEDVTGQGFAYFITNGEWDIDDSDVEMCAEFAARAFRTSRDDISTFDFNDQIYGPVYHQWRFPSLGTVLVDESQDLNRIQHLFVEELVKEGARLIAVGDRHQSIYAFRGALTDSMDLLKAQFSMTELPLSISYRCPISVVREAQLLVPHIEERPGAPEGRVYSREEIWASATYDLPVSPAEDPELFEDGVMVVCRNNAPLFAAVMRHVRARRPCRVRSNALEGLASFIKKLRPRDPDDLILKVNRWLEKESIAAQAKGMDWKVASIEDKAATVMCLAEGFDTVDEILSMIRSLSQGQSGPIFSTIHKAKGLEAEHVYFLRPDLVPGWWIKEPAALQQEYNLRYVAITRAKSTLTYGVKGK